MRFPRQSSELILQVHVGTQNCTKNMENYIYARHKNGVHYLNLAKTWEKLMVAARVVCAVQAKCPKDVLVSFANAPNSFLQFADRLLAPLRAARRAQVRHLHRRELPRRQVGARYSDQPEHQEVSSAPFSN